MVPARDLGSARTKPISRRVVTTGTGREHVVDRRRNVRRLGEIAQSKLVVTESVEGYLDNQGHIQQYYLVQVANPNCSRKQWHFPSSGVHLRIREPWFDGDSGEPWQARHQVADALKVHLAYRRSVALADISTAVDNVFVQNASGVPALEQLGAGLRQRLWRTGSHRSPVVELGGICETIAPGS